MAQTSRFWDGTAVGDATVAPYDAVTEFSRVMQSISGAGGIATNQAAVFRGELNELAVTGVATPVSVASGRAITAGTWYENDAALTVAIPTPAVSTRIDRIVLRKDWSALVQTVRVTRIAGVEGGGAPALVQIYGTTWDQPLALASITTGGVITVTDQREFINSILFKNLATLAIGNLLYADTTRSIAALAAGGTGAMLRIVAGLPAWLAVGAAGTALISDGTNPAWTAIADAYLSGDTARLNLLTNPGLEIWQRGTSAITSSGAYTADRWQQVPGAGSTFSTIRDATNFDINSIYCAAVTYVHSAASDIEQEIESGSAMKGRTVTFSMRVRTATAAAVFLRVYDGVGQTDSTDHPGTGAYVTLSVTRALNAAATRLSVRVQFKATCTAYLDNATLVLGSVAMNYQPMPPADDMARCQRYYEVHGGVNGATPQFGVYASANNETPAMTIMFHVKKSGVPTMTKSGTWAITNGAAQPGVTGPNTDGYLFYLTALAAGVTTGSPNSTDDTITAEHNP